MPVLANSGLTYKVGGAIGSYKMHDLRDQVRGSAPFAMPFHSPTKNDHFTKTGSGQTWGNLTKREMMRFGQVVFHDGFAMQVTKTVFFKAICTLKMMILPRQARDRHWESTQKKTIVLLQFRAGETTSVRLGKTKVDTHTYDYLHTKQALQLPFRVLLSRACLGKSSVVTQEPTSAEGPCTFLCLQGCGSELLCPNQFCPHENQQQQQQQAKLEDSLHQTAEVRKRLFLAPVYTKTPDICQDRLEANMGKVEKKDVFIQVDALLSRRQAERTSAGHGLDAVATEQQHQQEQGEAGECVVGPIAYGFDRPGMENAAGTLFAPVSGR
jgi:hypothetical protein